MAQAAHHAVVAVHAAGAVKKTVDAELWEDGMKSPHVKFILDDHILKSLKTDPSVHRIE